MKKIILNNCRITIGEVFDVVGILFGSRQAIFKEVLGMELAPGNIIPKLLRFDQK